MMQIVPQWMTVHNRSSFFIYLLKEWLFTGIVASSVPTENTKMDARTDKESQRPIAFASLVNLLSNWSISKQQIKAKKEWWKYDVRTFTNCLFRSFQTRTHFIKTLNKKNHILAKQNISLKLFGLSNPFLPRKRTFFPLVMRPKRKSLSHPKRCTRPVSHFVSSSFFARDALSLKVPFRSQKLIFLPTHSTAEAPTNELIWHWTLTERTFFAEYFANWANWILNCRGDISFCRRYASLGSRDMNMRGAHEKWLSKAATYRTLMIYVGIKL